MGDPRRSSLISTDDQPSSPPPLPAGRFPAWAGFARRGALVGFGVGLLALAVALAVVWRCLPFYITYPPLPWPWYCAEPAYSTIAFLAFPINLITDDLAQAIRLAPLSLLFYTLVGAWVGMGVHWLHLRRSSST
ncbi:MAG: hypothetical protein KatS3mg046_657 [Bellilinea sp.]|nr:MAG: hypothetical protein KatS3mg046_657 [Bellilinea sp.]